MTLSTSKLAGSTFMALEYNEITYNINSSKTYDATVYQDATKTYAVSKTGTILSSVTTASETDDIPIQAAITYCATDGGTVFIQSPGMAAAGEYNISSKVTVKKLVNVVCSNNHRVKFTIAEALAIAFDFEKGACWTGGFFDVPGNAHTGTIFYMDGKNSGRQWIYSRPFIRDVYFSTASATGTGTAIWFDCREVGAATAGFYNYVVDNCQFDGPWEYGILISTSVGAALYEEGFVWCSLNNLWFWGCLNAIYFDKAGAYGSLWGNVFTNIHIQSGTAPPYSDSGLNIAGDGNYFYGVTQSDWSTDCGNIINFVSDSQMNQVEIDSDYLATQWFSDSGNNSIKIKGNVWQTPITLLAKDAIVPLTNPATIVTTESSGNYPMTFGLFKSSNKGTERLAWTTPIESVWNGGTFTAKIEASNATAEVSTAIWQLYASRIADLDHYYDYPPTLVATIKDVMGSSWRKNLSEPSSAFTIGGTTNIGNTILWELKLASTSVFSTGLYLVGVKILSGETI